MEKRPNFRTRRKARINRSLELHQECKQIGPTPPITIDIRTEHLCPKPRMTRSDKWKKRPCVERWMAYKDLVAMTYRRAGGRTYFSPVSIGFEFTLLNRRKIDLDNLIKGVIDALTGLAWPDDSVSHIRSYDYARVIFKEYGPFCGSESAVVMIRELS
jgi:Holliday junction resolvase RusA-like endonuclease